MSNKVVVNLFDRDAIAIWGRQIRKETPSGDDILAWNSATSRYEHKQVGELAGGLLADYAGISIDNNTTPTVFPLVDSYVKVAVFSLNSAFNTSTPSFADNHIAVGGPGDYEIAINVNASAALNNKAYRFRAMEIGAATKAITGATQANPVIITSVAHGFANGDRVKVSGVVGMTQLNDRIFTVSAAAADSFAAQNEAEVNLDGAAFGAYTSGGIVQLATRTIVQVKRKFGVANDIGAQAASNFVPLGMDELVELYGLCLTDTTDITIDSGNLSITRKS